MHPPPPDGARSPLADPRHPAWPRLTGEELLAQPRSQQPSRRARDLLRADDHWSEATLEPYVEERRERMRRLRFGAQVQSALYSEFGEAAQARRTRTFARFEEDPTLMMPLVAGLVGPEAVPEDSFTEATRERILGG